MPYYDPQGTYHPESKIESQEGQYDPNPVPPPPSQPFSNAPATQSPQSIGSEQPSSSSQSGGYIRDPFIPSNTGAHSRSRRDLSEEQTLARLYPDVVARRAERVKAGKSERLDGTVKKQPNFVQRHRKLVAGTLALAGGIVVSSLFNLPGVVNQTLGNKIRGKIIDVRDGFRQEHGGPKYQVSKEDAGIKGDLNLLDRWKPGQGAVPELERRIEFQEGKVLAQLPADQKGPAQRLFHTKVGDYAVYIAAHKAALEHDQDSRSSPEWKEARVLDQAVVTERADIAKKVPKHKP